MPGSTMTEEMRQLGRDCMDRASECGYGYEVASTRDGGFALRVYPVKYGAEPLERGVRA